MLRTVGDVYKVGAATIREHVVRRDEVVGDMNLVAVDTIE